MSSFFLDCKTYKKGLWIEIFLSCLHLKRGKENFNLRLRFTPHQFSFLKRTTRPLPSNRWFIVPASASHVHSQLYYIMKVYLILKRNSYHFWLYRFLPSFNFAWFANKLNDQSWGRDHTLRQGVNLLSWSRKSLGHIRISNTNIHKYPQYYYRHMHLFNISTNNVSCGGIPPRGNIIELFTWP